MRAGITTVVILWAMTAGTAQAFDCAKASGDIEKAICGNESPKQANDAMEAAYFALRDRQNQEGKKLLTEGQRAWLKYRDSSCGAEAGCLEQYSNARRDWLAATPEGMTPYFLYKPAAQNDYEVVVDAYFFTDARFPAAAQWNAAVERIVAESPYAAPPDTEEHSSQYIHEIFVLIEHKDANFLSGSAGFFDYSGGAHPNTWSESINIDAKSGALIDAVSVFGDDGIGKLIDLCMKQIVTEKDDEYGDMSEDAALQHLEEQYPGKVREHVSDMKRWYFNDDGGVVSFDSYDIGPYAAGPFDCMFDWPTVKGTAVEKRLFELVK